MRLRKWFFTSIAGSIIGLVSPSQVWAQAAGTILGMVRDSSRAVIPGASVTITNELTGLQRKTVSNNVGNYIAPALPPGQYIVEADFRGFRRKTINGVELQVDQEARIDITLDPGGPTEHVEVTADASLLNTESPALGQVIENNRVLNLPLNGRRFLELTLEAPGVVIGNGGPQSGSSTLFMRPGQDSSISVSGGRSQNNSFLLDGTQNTDPDVNAYVVSPSIDTIQEFKMETHNYSAEFGRSSGGQISVVTKSGTNLFHGSGSEFLRNDAVDARPFNNPGKLPVFRRNQFGATLGGPIRRDRTFFFTSYEGFRRVEGQSNTQTIPTAKQRNGDFSETVGIFDPLSAASDPSDPTGKRLVRTQFPGNAIPAGRLNPVALRLINGFVPPPDLPGVANNYLDTRQTRQRNNQESARIDHRLTSKDNVFGRHTLSNETAFLPTGLPGSGTSSHVRAQNLTLSETHVAGPSLVNEFKFGFSRLRLERLSENAFKRDVVNEVGLAGVQYGGPEVWGIPSITIPGYATIGDDNFFQPMRLRDNSFQELDNLTWVRGKHNFKFGAEVRQTQFNIIQAFTPRGDIRFNSGQTTRFAGTGGADPTGSSLASFLLGLPTQQRRTVGVTPSYLRQLAWGAYAQDNWKIGPRMTISIGLRYDSTPPWVDRYDRLPNVSFQGIPSINNIADQGLQGKYSVPIVLAGKNGTPRGLTTADRLDFAPRFGLAWRPTANDKLVLRASYGLFYGATDAEHVGRVAINAPFVVSDTQDGDTFLPRISGIGFSTPPAPGGPLRQTFIGLQENLRMPYTHQWNLAIQFEPVRNLAAEIAYVGSASHKLDYRDAENDAPLGPGVLDDRRLFQTMSLPADLPSLPSQLVSRTLASGTIEIQTNRVNSNYHGLQTKVERRYRSGFTLLGSYTWSKTIADGNSYRRQGAQGELAQDFLHNRERGLTGYDVRQRFVSSFVYNLPIGSGKRFAVSNKVLDRLVGGWQINGIFQVQTGFPLTALLASSTANNGRSTRPNVVAGESSALAGDQRSVRRFFNAAAFAAPPPLAVGNSGVMNITGPGLHTLDGSILKTVPLRETHSLQLRFEFFNAYNHPSWGAPNATLGAPAFNTISSQSVPPRQLQLGVKYLF